MPMKTTLESHELISTQTLPELSKNIACYLWFSLPLAGLGNGISGSISKWGYSFFNPAVASTLGGFFTFAGMGVLTSLITTIPNILTLYGLNQIPYLQENPELKIFLYDACSFLYSLAAVAASAAIMGSPIGPAVICMMAFPAIMLAFSAIELIYIELTKEDDCTKSIPSPA